MKSNLKEIREEAGKSLQELADLCGTSKGHMHHLESENANPTLSTAYAISAVLGKPVHEIWPDTTEIVETTIVVRKVVQK